MMNTHQRLFVVMLFFTLFVSSLEAGLFRDSIDAESPEKEATLSAHVHVLKNISYGTSRHEVMDVYLPVKAVPNAPIIFMVHGGAWIIGDKGNESVIQNKVPYFVEQKNAIFVSINYPMLPSTPVLEQLHSVAKALGYVQKLAPQWQTSAQNVILMGHSAGGHLIAMLSAEDALYTAYGITPPKAAVFLDSAVYDTPALMRASHLRLYDRAFGDNPTFWRYLSPYHRLDSKRMPMLAVCSTKREDSCPQAKAFLDKAASLGTKTQLLTEAMSHKEINLLVGKEAMYTQSIESFLQSLEGSH